jgi:hypothetical protein
MPQAGLDPSNQAATCALDRAATGIGCVIIESDEILISTISKRQTVSLRGEKETGSYTV